MSEQLTDVLLYINNEQIGIVPGSFRFTPGFGDRQILAQSEGGGRVSQVFATNQATAFSRFNFEMYVTPDNEKRLRKWLTLRNRNAGQWTAKDDDGKRITRTVTQACVMNDPEIQFSVDGRITVEFQGNQSV